MALNVSEGQFVLPGSNFGQQTAALAQTAYQRNMANQRLDLAKEQKREEAGKFIESATDPAHFGTGTVYDPVITQNLTAARSKAVALAQQGADIPTIMQQIGPDMEKVNQYYTAAKTINKQIDDSVKAMHENKMDVGYKLADAKAGALKSALMQQDKDGNWVLQDPANINLSKNYLTDEITNHPEQYTTNEALEDYAKNSPKSTRQDAVTSVDKNMRTNKTSVKVTGANWEVPEMDANGKIQMVPKYDHATDGGQVLTHTVDGAEQPIRLMDEQAFDQMMANRPGAADYIKGQVRLHAGDYKDANGKPLDMSSPQAKLIARGIAYKELANAGNSTVSTIEQAGRPTGAEINLHYYGDDYQRSYNRESGKDAADWNDFAAGKKVPKAGADKENMATALSDIWNNKPERLVGPTLNKDGVNVIDVTKQLPKAEIRYGHGEKDAYKGAYYDPKTRQMLFEKKDGTFDHVQESQAGIFMGRIAEANGVPISQVKTALQGGGWANGRFSSPGNAPDIDAEANKQNLQTTQNHLGTTIYEISNGKSTNNSSLKGTKVADGTVMDISKNKGWFNGVKYDVKVQGPDGSIKVVPVKNDDALKKYILHGAPKAAASSASPQKKSAEDLLKENGL